jgi:hypothetical protein
LQPTPSRPAYHHPLKPNLTPTALVFNNRFALPRSTRADVHDLLWGGTGSRSAAPHPLSPPSKHSKLKQRQQGREGATDLASRPPLEQRLSSMRHHGAGGASWDDADQQLELAGQHQHQQHHLHADELAAAGGDDSSSAPGLSPPSSQQRQGVDPDVPSIRHSVARCASRLAGLRHY